MNYTSLKAIATQLECCGYQTADGIHRLEHNAAFIALKEEAEINEYLPSDRLELLRAGLAQIINQANRLHSGNAPHGVAGIKANAQQLLSILEPDGL
ncbi:MAG: hypothetical protein V1775_18300 [Bacteroidota bacterium]